MILLILVKYPMTQQTSFDPFLAFNKKSGALVSALLHWSNTKQLESSRVSGSVISFPPVQRECKTQPC